MTGAARPGRFRVVAGLVALLVAGPASAQELSSWERLHDSLLLETANHDVEQAAANYEQLARDLGADDPVRSEALYWLGRLRYEHGEVEGAREALRECVRSGVMKGECLELLGQIELEQGGITTVPVEWTFDDTTHGFIHPWRYAHKGSIRIHRAGDRPDPMLAWTTTVDVRSDDQLVVGFDDPTPLPSGLKFLLMSKDLEAFLRLQVYDIYGRRYSLPSDEAVVRVPAGQMVIVRLPFDELVGEDPEQAPFEPEAIDRLVLQDVTAYYGETMGENELFIDDFQVY